MAPASFPPVIAVKPAMEFRKDINGLRSYAVIAVVLYHFGLGGGFAGLPGGFAGVDVFFVISGFLMTGIIVTRLNGGSFSLADFYLSRARRILPALLALCLALLVFGYFWLIPSDYAMLGKHAAASAGFVSNIVYLGEEGYFDAPSHDKWMLHTWSLSVEWQFYLVYPLLLMTVSRLKVPRKFAGLMLALGVLTFASSVWLTETSSSFAFYMLPARTWEFMAGGLVFLAGRRFSGSAKLEWAGFALIFASFCLFNSDSPWPGYAAAVPILGAALVLLAGRENSSLTGNAGAQALGTWSYSIYLWHWPVVVALGYFGFTGAGYAAFGVMLSLLLGAASYVFVETPTRKKMARLKSRQAWGVIAGVLGFVVLLGTGVVMADGINARVSPQILAIDRATDSRAEGKDGCGFDAATKKLTPCRVGKGSGPRFALWGDSHAGALVKAMEDAAGGSGDLYSYSCPVIFNATGRSKKRGHGCTSFHDGVMAAIKSLPKDEPLVVASRYSFYLLGPNDGTKRLTGLDYDDPPAKGESPEDVFAARLTDSLCMVQGVHPLYAVKPVPEIGMDVPKTAARRLMAGREMPDIAVTLEAYRARNAVALRALEDAKRKCGVRLLDPVPYLCKNGRCSGMKNGLPLYFDDNHLNDHGNAVLVPMLAPVFNAEKPR